MRYFFAIAAAVITSTMLGLAACSYGTTEESQKVKAHLTIYVEKPLLTEGGTVIVAANPVSAEKWAALSDGENIAANDMNNAKRADLKKGDRLFGVAVSAQTSVVEFIYPEGGAFGFNFVARNTDGDGRTPQLRTDEISIGDGGADHSLTGVPWDYVSVIHVIGPGSTEGKSRAASVLVSEILASGSAAKDYQGTVVHSLDPRIVNGILEKFDGSR
jgi:hypothetical protein